jgi:hypothetical protein
MPQKGSGIAGSKKKSSPDSQPIGSVMDGLKQAGITANTANIARARRALASAAAEGKDLTIGELKRRLN